MLSIRELACAFAALALTGCAQKPVEMPVPIDQVTADLKTIATARVFFAHQSVGRNILEGVRELSTQTGVRLRIVEVKAGEAPTGAGLFHTFIGENGDPDRKLTEFVASVSGHSESTYDVAMLKFCYVDLEDGSKEQSPSALLTRYESSMAGLAKERPQTSLIHATMPLTADPRGWKTTLKRWLGRATWTDEANRRRGEYNRQLRRLYATGDIFDLAHLEATRPDGSLSSFTRDGREVETMFAGYTPDGGHLTDAAARRMAAAFLHSLAGAVRGRGAAGAPPQTAPR